MPVTGSPELCPNAFCQGHVMGDRAGRNCTTTYACGAGTFTKALNDSVPHELLVRTRTAADKRWKFVEGYPGLAAYCWNKKLATVLARFLGGFIKDNAMDGICELLPCHQRLTAPTAAPLLTAMHTADLDGYAEADRVRIGAEHCDVVDHGTYSTHLHMDAPKHTPNLQWKAEPGPDSIKKQTGRCGYDGKEPCNMTEMMETCDAIDGCAGFNSNGWLKQGPLNASLLEKTSTAVTDNTSFYLRNGSSVTCEWDFDGDGKPDSPTQHEGMYWSWRSAFVAMIRQILGEDAVIVANSGGGLSDPSLSGLSIEMESCTAGRGGIEHCANALEGQEAATKAAGRTPLSVRCTQARVSQVWFLDTDSVFELAARRCFG